MAERPRAADDFNAIRLNQDRINGRCAIREGGSSASCWCYKAGPDGNTLPCPPLNDPADVLSEVSCGLIDHPLYGSTYVRAFQITRKIKREILKEYME